MKQRVLCNGYHTVTNNVITVIDNSYRLREILVNLKVFKLTKLSLYRYYLKNKRSFFRLCTVHRSIPCFQLFKSGRLVPAQIIGVLKRMLCSRMSTHHKDTI